MTDPAKIEAFFLWLIEANGYRDPRVISETRYAAILPKLFTQAIITGHIGDQVGLGDCWCYEDYRSAKQALDRWDGRGEPIGWIRHPDSGRRVSRSAGEIDFEGQPVGGAGVAYVRP